MQKKLKKIISLTLIIILVFSIYTIFKSNKINYIALGDGLAKGLNPYGEIGYSYTDYLSDYLKSNNKLNYYTKKYTSIGLTTDDLIKEIRINSELKKDLRESDLVTISIGANDFLEEIDIKNINENNIPELMKIIDKVIIKIDNCLKEIRKYAKQDIMIIGYYNPKSNLESINSLFIYFDKEYEKLAKKYNFIYVPIYNSFIKNKNYLPNINSNLPNLEGYQEIFEQMCNYSDSKIK